MYVLDRRRPRKGMRGFLQVLGLLAIVVVVGLGGNLLHPIFPPASYLTYLLVLVLAYFVVRTMVEEYRYRCQDGKLQIERLSGQRARPLMVVDLNDMTYYGPPGDEKAQRFVLKEIDVPVRAVLWEEDGKRLALHLQPDDKLDELLQGGWKTMQKEEAEDTKAE